MTNSSSSRVNPAASDTGRVQGYRYCCEILVSYIHDRDTLSLIEAELSKHKHSTRKRCETVFAPEIRSGKLEEKDFDEIVDSEENALQYVIDLLIV